MEDFFRGLFAKYVAGKNTESLKCARGAYKIWKDL